MSAFTGTALGQAHIPGADGRRSLCGLRLSAVSCKRKLPECGFCAAYAGIPRIIYPATRRAQERRAKEEFEAQQGFEAKEQFEVHLL